MSAQLEHPLLLSTSLKLDMVNIGGHWLEFRPIFYTWCVMALLAVVALFIRKRLTLIPNSGQSFFETLIGGLEDFVVANTGEEGRKIFPVLCGIFIFIAGINLIGLVPGCDAPTANINTNIAMALSVFVYYNYVGIAKWRAHYVHHFMGPMLPLVPLMLPLEIISHTARPLSLTLRLFGNIRGEEIVLWLLFILAPLYSTLPLYFLFFIAKALQAFIFFMLTMIYLKGAIEPAH
ncbi:F0F1 ATP synthase subunit A [Desulfovibrio litoralis]|uniref:ATP synthase subunit a n=1 Tax=Desulfovibrio litoralis DSM 11393 TaxID=1121455 RepID=A0A1M7S831_9BACT|nr:F0F1 ATP synthase subunit A [Desulfovibrio litoralis]SHN54545.1 ATP synthase F0 subcomplex A subunit [Desulfovibrio litoralis DSM 11393]